MPLSTRLAALSTEPWCQELASDLGRLASERLGPLRIFETSEQARRAAPGWSPVYLVPLGVAGHGRIFGLDARPDRVHAGRASIAMVLGDRDLLGVADGLRGLLRFVLAEAELEERLSSQAGRSGTFEQLHARIQTALGVELFDASALDGVDDAGEWAWSRGDRSPYAAMSRTLGDDPEANLNLLDEALAADPGCMYLHLRASDEALMARQREEAAGHQAGALRCHRYTRHNYELDATRGGTEVLARRYPAPFDRRDVAAFLASDPAALRALVDEARAAGDLERAARLAMDLGFVTGDTDSLIDPLLRPMFQELGWSWALRLCDLRQGR